MNSRERRKLAALQHNDTIRYEAWLKANAICSRASLRYHNKVSEYQRGRRAGMSRLGALTLANIVMMGGLALAGN
jgi:hypothetical protein